jgi:hypothetical protein
MAKPLSRPAIQSLLSMSVGGVKSVFINVCKGKPVMRSMIAQKSSPIAQVGFIYPTVPNFAIKLHTSNSFGRCAIGFITPSHPKKAQFQTQRGDIHE